VRWNTATLPKYVSSMWSNTEAWQYIRKSPDLIDMFTVMGEHIVQELNWELNAAQARRKQKVEDGYKFAVSVNDDRIRMRIWAFTARAAAHEAKHQSILKHMQFVGDINKGTGGRRNPGPNFGKRGGSKKTGGRRRTRPPPRRASRRPSMDSSEERKLRRRLESLDRLAAESGGAGEHERKSAAEKARRIRKRLGE
jgi:hypothetical protein